MIDLLQVISHWAIPLLVLVVPVIGWLKGVRVYEAFVEGAREGFDTAVRIIPYLVAMFVAVHILRESGAMAIMVAVVQPVTMLLGIPGELLPLALIRPLSGSGSMGMVGELLESVGPDSPLGLIASIMQGSTETTFYVLTVYFGAVGIRRIRHALAAGLLADAAGVLAAVYFARLAFGL